MIIAITAIASAWFGLFSAYLFAAHQLPAYYPAFAKNIFSKPLNGLAIGVAFAGFYMAWVSDPVTLGAFEFLGIRNNGIADSNVQITSLLLTALIGVPIVITYRRLAEVASRIDADKDEKKYYPWAGFLMAFVAVLFATSSALLAISNK